MSLSPLAQAMRDALDRILSATDPVTKAQARQELAEAIRRAHGRPKRPETRDWAMAAAGEKDDV
jgi:hypothetical protein